MQVNAHNYKNIRVLSLQSSYHKNILDTYVSNMKTYSSGMTISAVLHHKNYDVLFLDMLHNESMEVLQSIKQFLPDTVGTDTSHIKTNFDYNEDF